MKKNFIYDYIHVIPAMLNQAKYEELKEKDPFFTKCYTLQDNGFYRCGNLDKEDAAKLRDYFKRVGFSALNFTDSRSVYQFYALKYLWTHIERAMKLGIRKLNLAVEPLSVQEVYAYLNGGQFVNELAKEPFDIWVRLLFLYFTIAGRVASFPVTSYIVPHFSHCTCTVRPAAFAMRTL